MASGKRIPGSDSTGVHVEKNPDFSTVCWSHSQWLYSEPCKLMYIQDMLKTKRDNSPAWLCRVQAIRGIWTKKSKIMWVTFGRLEMLFLKKTWETWSILKYVNGCHVKEEPVDLFWVEATENAFFLSWRNSLSTLSLLVMKQASSTGKRHPIIKWSNKLWITSSHKGVVQGIQHCKRGWTNYS